jgi:hypothetical protein
MNTGSVKVRSKAVGNSATGLRFEVDRLIVVFRDGREIHVPLRLYPSLLRATADQRSAWQMLGRGKAFHWPELDLDLSVDGLVQGLREAIPAPPKLVARRG